ncbi:hypothetical protein VMCG_08807 [Cytospora schulzeri]|uniref:Uncharacterized protein n=1 Tax=Cytospora schulzeri TaxID=448051 RepID=A0A423VS32_9PEZI|nr:hypothetical protein VMCG_08807 [Valsa malicola]
MSMIHIFPSSYRDGKKDQGSSTTTKTHEELQLQLSHHKAGREGSQYSSYSASADLPPRKEQQHPQRYSEEEVRITREEDRYRRPGARREEYYREELKEQQPSPIDHIEREYRARSQPGIRENISVTETTVDTPVRRPAFKETVHIDETTVETPRIRPTIKDTVRVDEIVEIDRSHRHKHPKTAEMVHYEDDSE